MLNRHLTLEGGGNDGNSEKHLGRIARVGEDHHAVGGERIVRYWFVDDVLLGNIFFVETAVGILDCVSFPDCCSTKNTGGG